MACEIQSNFCPRQSGLKEKLFVGHARVVGWLLNTGLEAISRRNEILRQVETQPPSFRRSYDYLKADVSCVGGLGLCLVALGGVWGIGEMEEFTGE